MTASAWPGETAETGVDQLWARLREVESRVRAMVAARRAVDPDPDDPYRGQYLSPQAAERLLDQPTAGERDAVRPLEAPAPPPGSRLARLTSAFHVSPIDVEFLLVALAPDLDARFERLYGYLNDDLAQRRATVGLALELCGLSAADPRRFRLAAGGPLVAGGLVEIVQPDRPPLSRELRVPDRVTAWLLGDDKPDAALRGLVQVGRGDAAASDDGGLRRARAAVASGAGLVHLLDQGGDAGQVAADALAGLGLRTLTVDVVALAAAPGLDRLASALVREARLSHAGLVLGPLERFEPRRPERARLLREVCAGAEAVPVIAHGGEPWEPTWARNGPVTVVLQPVDGPRRARQWARALAAAHETHEARVADAADTDGRPWRGDDGLVDAVAAYRLDSEQVARAAAVAVRSAAADGRAVRAEDVRAAARAQNGNGLARLARRIEPAVGWDDLVLPEPTARQLRGLALRARHRDQVLGQWRMRPGGGRGRGVIALFAGEPGTGKTMSAEVVAAELGVDLYVVDLSTVVDKYVGETEKNLERVFAEAAGVNGVLLFDEADAIFGKRAQVKDAHDRHANIESAYLLQRVESFDGIAVLTTNLRANVDEAFIRRLDVVAEFPMPDERGRLALWERCLGPHVPRAKGLDLEFCARRFELSGGSIRACAVTAAYLAAEAGGPVDMPALIAAVLGEYRKLGRLTMDGEFGPWLDQARARV